MRTQYHPSPLVRFAKLTTNAIEQAINELATGDPAFCLDTLKTLHGLARELAADAAPLGIRNPPPGETRQEWRSRR